MSTDHNYINLMNHLMDNIVDNIYFMDRDHRIIMINEAGAKWLGFDSPDDVIGKTNLDIFTEEHGLEACADETQIMSTGIPILGKEEKETWEDGHETWVSTSKMPLRNGQGEIVGTFGISRDITEKKQAQILAEKYAKENRQFREDMESELRMAAELQKTFLPSSYPMFASSPSSPKNAVAFSHHYHSGGMIGGDYCSIRKLSATEAGIFLCDVMGHGVRAALGTAIVRAMVEQISNTEKDPGRYLKQMNNVLLPILQQEDVLLFATACYLILDVSTGIIKFANAGHPAPLVLDSETGKACQLSDDLSSSGTALALCEDSEYETREHQLNPGDAVILFTDGIYEVASSEEDEFGEQRLLAAVEKHRKLSLKELFPALIAEARQFSANDTFDDDVCLVGFRLRQLIAPS